MSKYVKELMMDQLKTELDGDRSVLILDLKGLDAITEYQFRRDLRKKSIKIRVAAEHAGPPGLRRHGDRRPLAVPGRPERGRLGRRRRRPSWPRRSPTRSRSSRSPRSRAGPVDGTVIGPEQVEDITKLPSREALIGRVVEPGPGPGPAGHHPGQRPGERPARPAQDPLRRGPGRRGEAERRRRRRPRPPPRPRPDRPRRPRRSSRDDRQSSESHRVLVARTLNPHEPRADVAREPPRKDRIEPWPPPKPPRSPTTSRPWATRSSS